jgi:hypothetical protein
MTAASPTPSVVAADKTDFAVPSALPSDASLITPAFIAATQANSSTATSGASATSTPPASDGALGNSIEPLVKSLVPANTSPAKGNSLSGAVDAVLADPLSNWLDD